MNTEIAAALRQALSHTLAQDPGRATAVIQAALAGRATPNFGDASPPATPPAGRQTTPLGKVVPLLRQIRSTTSGNDSLPRGSRRAGVTPLPLPEGAQFLDRRFSCAAGARNFRLYVPACAASELNGLVVMLHGCKQGPEDFAAGTAMNAVAETQRLLVAYPGQSDSANVSGCWNWFNPADQRRDTGEPAIIAGLTRAVAAEYGIAQNRIFIAGLSAGGAMAAVMGATYPELYDAIGIHSGLAYASANDVVSAFAVMRGEISAPTRTAARAAQNPPGRPRTIVFHGTADRTVHPSNAERIVAAASTGQDAIASRSERLPGDARRGCTRRLVGPPQGPTVVEYWLIDGAGHAWSGGHPSGSYTDPDGPDASAEMVRFFLNLS